MTTTVWCQAIMREVLTGKDFSSNYDTGFKYTGSAATVMNAVDGNDLRIYAWNPVGSTRYPPGGNPYQPTPTGVYDLFVHEFVLDHPGYRPAGMLIQADFVVWFRGEGWWNGVEVGSWPAYWDTDTGVGYPDGGHGYLNLDVRSWDPPQGSSPYLDVYVGGNVWQEKRVQATEDIITWLNSSEGDTYWLDGKTHPKDAQGYWSQKCYWPEDDPRIIVGVGSTAPGNQHMQDKDKTWVRLIGDIGGESDGTDGWQRSWVEVGMLGVEFTFDSVTTPEAPPPNVRTRGVGLGDPYGRQVYFPRG
jgi:hypothetical protein